MPDVWTGPRSWLVVLGVALLGTTAVAAQPQRSSGDDDDEYQPGLIGTYTAAGATVERIDPDIAFDWKGASPDSRLSVGPFRVRWGGRLLVRLPGRYRWHAFLSGTIQVSVDGRRVLTAKTDEPGWASSEEIELGFGEKPLEVSLSLIHI